LFYFNLSALQDAVVAAQFNKNRACWEATAKFWAQYHANAPGQLNAAYKDSFDKVVAMGFGNSTFTYWKFVIAVYEAFLTPHGHLRPLISRFIIVL
jgi:hypothetical protein